MSNRPDEHPKQDDPLTARLVSRLTEPVGLIDTSEPAQKYARIADWVAERFSLADRLSNKYAAEAQNSETAQTYVLGRPLQPQISSLASESLLAGPGSFDQPQFSVSGPGHHTSESPPSSGEMLRVSRRSPQIALRSDMMRLKSHGAVVSKPEQTAPAPSDETLSQTSTSAAYKQKQLAPPSSDETLVQRSSSADELVSRSPEAEPPLIRVAPTLEAVHGKIETDPRDTDDPPARSVQRRATRTPPAQGTPDASKAIHPEPETLPELIDGVNQTQTDSAPASRPARLTANTSTVQRKVKDTQSDSARAARKSPARARSKSNSDQPPPVVQRRPMRSPRSEEAKKGEPTLPSIEGDRRSPAISPPALPLAISRSSVQRKKKNEGSDAHKQQKPLGSPPSSSKETAPPTHSSHDSALRAQPLVLPGFAEPAHTTVGRKQNQRAEGSHLESESPGIGNSEASLPASSPQLRGSAPSGSSSIGPVARREPHLTSIEVERRSSAVSPPTHSSHDSVLKPPPRVLPRLAEPTHTSVSEAGSPESSPRDRGLAPAESASIGAVARQDELAVARKPEGPLAAARPHSPNEGMTLQRKSQPGHASTRQSQTSSPADEVSLNASGGLPIQRKKQTERSRISPTDSPISAASTAAGTSGIASIPEEQSTNGNAGRGSLVAPEIRANSGSVAEPVIIWRKTAGAGLAAGSAPNITSGPARIARKSEASASSGSVGPNSEIPAPAPEALGAPQGGGVDVGRITQQVLRNITRRLEVERERRGLGK